MGIHTFFSREEYRSLFFSQWMHKISWQKIYIYIYIIIIIIKYYVLYIIEKKFV